MSLPMVKTKTTSFDIKLVKQKLHHYASSIHKQQDQSINLEKPTGSPLESKINGKI